MKIRNGRRFFGWASVVVFVVALTSYSSAAALPRISDILSGSVLMSGGSPLAHASIQLTALESHRPKGPVSDPFIGKAEADSLGRFEIRIPPSPELIELASENDGVLNMQLWATGQAKTAVVASPTPEAPSSGSSFGGHQANTVGNALGTARSLPSTTLVAVEAVGAVVVDGANTANGKAFSAPNGVKLYATGVKEATNRSGDPQPCPTPQPPGPWYVVDDNYYFEPVGELHVYWDGTAKFTYGKTADSEMGVGYSHSYGPWSVSGTVHIGNSNSRAVDISGSAPASFPEQPFGHRIITKFHYLHERSSQGGDCNVVDRIRATEWIASILNSTDVSYRDGYDRANYVWQNCPASSPEACFGEYGPRAHFGRQSAKAVKYTAGVSAFGVQLSAQSGYSTMVQMDWTFGNQPDTHYLFYDKPPYDTAPQVYSY